VAKIDPAAPDLATVERAAAVLRSGGLVAFPTETVYGLGANALDTAAVRSIFAGKGRPATDPLIVHIPSVDAAGEVVASWPDAARRLAEAFWPGPLTLVLAKAGSIPPEVTAGGPSVGVRVPAHPVAVALLTAAAVPVAAPSANRFGRVSPTSALHVQEELDGVYDLLLDGGPAPLGVESTVVDLSGPSPRMLRPGGVPLEDLQEVLGPVEHVDRAARPEASAASSPGQFLRHYAPSTPLVLVEGAADLPLRLRAALDDAGVAALVLSLDADPDLAARELYSSLRQADQLHGIQVLLASTIDPAGVGRAVNDRLYRAAHGRVVLDDSESSLRRVLAAVDR
jgi:L-threonylcarbamoyladenylate synthase